MGFWVTAKKRSSILISGLDERYDFVLIGQPNQMIHNLPVLDHHQRGHSPVFRRKFIYVHLAKDHKRLLNNETKVLRVLTNLVIRNMRTWLYPWHEDLTGLAPLGSVENHYGLFIRHRDRFVNGEEAGSCMTFLGSGRLMSAGHITSHVTVFELVD